MNIYNSIEKTVHMYLVNTYVTFFVYGVNIYYSIRINMYI